MVVEQIERDLETKRLAKQVELQVWSSTCDGSWSVDAVTVVGCCP
jgi:hypothetical protein